MYLPQSISDIVWAGMLYEFHQSIKHLDPSASREDYEEYWYQIDQCAPDSSEFEYELECFELEDPSWITPSLVL